MLGLLVGENTSSLAAFPALAAVYDRLLAEVRDRHVDAVVRGSIASGQVDRFSDIDLLVVVPEGSDASSVERDLLCTIRQYWTVLSEFTASHLGLDGLHVLFLDVEDTVVKVDVEVVRAGAPHDAARPGPELLAARMCGWLWYTATKIARGELFEAADSLGIMRRDALLPYLLLQRGLPQEGYRRLEQRLGPDVRAQLAGTHPRAFEAPELWRALLATYGWFVQLCSEGGVPDETLRRLRRMLELARPLSDPARDQ
ncbi:MAG TPA: nucleotidyltransferase domain-containing protein [Candidatus Dormibacteraeota bacterium]|nr:nucleotidyltransferase domain-containing protein [Candidatus Dormibacteraeota bacterium]